MHLHSRSKVLYVLLISTTLVVVLSFAFLYVFPSYSISSINNTNNASALTYSSDTDVSFTFNPTLSISLSDTNINIDNLLPGLSSESSPITVHVNSNTPYGYSLFASVGNSTDYNTTSLVHGSNDNSNDNSSNNNNNSNNNSIPATFTSIATNASLPQLTQDNTWGYSLSSDNGTTWSNYNGLPLYSTVDNNTSTNNPALLIDTKSPADSTKSIDFKIAAKASSTQASGTYNNVINFYAVGKPESFVPMQDTATIKATLNEVGDEMKVMDERDGKVYWVTKQTDGNIWMTQNLDLCIGCEGTATLTSHNTDLNTSGIRAYYDGYTNVDGLITWTPADTAKTSNHLIGDDGSVSGWTANYFYPYSVEGGEKYLYTSGTTEDDHIYTSLAECARTGHSADECGHYHVGNYYNWSAAAASNYSYNAYSGDEMNSICPAGWRLPTASYNRYELGQLVYNLGITVAAPGLEVSSASYKTDGFKKVRSSPLYLVRSGIIGNTSLSLIAKHSSYWSGSFSNYMGANTQSFTVSSFDSASNQHRGNGLSIRCIMRQN